MRGAPAIAAAAGLVLGAPAGLGCPPPPAPRPPEPTPAEVHRAVLLRPGGLFVQARLDRLRTLLPSLGEIVTLAATPSLPGAACLVDLLWSCDLGSAFLATAGQAGPPVAAVALVEGTPAPPEQVASWADCVLAGLGSGTAARAVPAAPPGEAAGGAGGATIEFVTGTGRWSDLGLAAVAPARYAIVVREPFDAWARELAGTAPPPPGPEAPFAERVSGADVQAVWLDPPALAALLDDASAGLGPVPPPAELRGLAAGLWLGEEARLEVVIQARGPDAAAAVAQSLRTVSTMLELSTSVTAALLGRDFGAEIQARAEQVVELARRARIEALESVALVHLALTPADLDLLQGFALALASRELRE